MIDLHMHTTYSDGVSQVDELVKAAMDAGLQAIAITDHDNTGSYALAKEFAKDSPIEIIPGIEINTVWKGQEVHVLGFYIDPEDDNLQELIAMHRKRRITQIEKMVDLLNKAKVKVTFEDIASRTHCHGTMGRPHVAQAIVEKGGAATISEAFDRYLNPKAVTYLRRETAPPHEAVEAIYESGGIPVIAHPGDMPIIEELAVDLMNYGLRGLEAYHKSHSPGTIEFHCSLAEKLGLIVTGGTDFHGPAENYANALTRLRMPDYVYAELHKERDRLGMATFKAS